MSGPGSQDEVAIVVVDDHTLFREGLREMLLTDPHFRVVGEGASGTDAVALAERLQPDVVLLDVEMPGPGARVTISRLRFAAPFTRIVILTMHDDPVLVHDLLESGASAYMVKTVAKDELIAAVRSVTRGDGNVVVSVSRTTIERLDRQQPAGKVVSERELEVLKLLAKAKSNAQIASELFITPGTVKRHLTNIYAKLGAVSRMDAVRKATAARLIKGVED
ncbi:response regulator transcription factor [Actinokineospora auranticolor]|uniref:DNA-binding NarL/FixJ family response regulator n=1 Tax=Actinokineospora auranticolor TaxID=155976 RepID=A0A2S6GCZ9_9PSEU|nr:response regulator transcription factor [Actinokineospora auranticolor]PPK63133.1 DNA-binding NarL/FixJ family response regulator [Actinokineospora auranticolor]